MSQYLRKCETGLVLLVSALVLQAQDAKPGAQPSVEFPVSLQTRVVAGATPAGTEVRAKLTIATLMDGVVIPQDAMITGHVEQSVAKTSDAPSLLKIKFESVRWKKGTAPLNLYLAGCYYPVEFNTSANNTSGMHGEIGVMMGGAPRDPFSRPNGGMPDNNGAPNLDAGHQGNYPDPRPDISQSEVSKHWIRMEKVDTVTAPDGGLEIISAERTIKLDKGTTYLLRNSAPPAAKLIPVAPTESPRQTMGVSNKPKPGDLVVITKVSPEFLDDLAAEDQQAIAEVIGKPVLLSEYDDEGKAELEFADKAGTLHFIYVGSDMIKASE